MSDASRNRLPSTVTRPRSVGSLGAIGATDASTSGLSLTIDTAPDAPKPSSVATPIAAATDTVSVASLAMILTFPVASTVAVAPIRAETLL